MDKRSQNKEHIKLKEIKEVLYGSIMLLRETERNKNKKNNLQDSMFFKMLLIRTKNIYNFRDYFHMTESI